MPTIIEIKNRTNWVLTIAMSIGLMISFFIILIIILIGLLQSNDFIAVLNVLSMAGVVIGFFILFLYIWLWNTFGKTVFNIETNAITVSYKNKLFAKPKTFLKKEIKDIQAVDYSIESYKYGTRYHFSWTGATYSVVLITRDYEKRIISWITEDKAYEIVDEVKKVWR
ncbi:hypothetical protein [Chryseobacterium oncorhynchi]|uniref:Bacterial Pleckstrin homology domain-containing protein n=1 Tax=Chryseobacterium oncorhynchi TaxID=741074 RepID=A0A316WS15_9FLAO|nr:hypothetical protein [Chryseobacterium oncorhynchi]PWN63306.1 hypothetical protein C1638_014665 [Chryseobacterium oncorhynchi]